MGTACHSLVDPKEERLDEIIKSHSRTEGALIPVLQQAQEIYGYLPPEVLKKVSQGLKIPIAQIYGVATFYSQFRLAPIGRNIIQVCLGTACHVRGGAKVLEVIEQQLGVKDGQTTSDERYTLEIVACMGACGLAPVIAVNGNVHGRLTPDIVSGILDQYE